MRPAKAVKILLLRTARFKKVRQIKIDRYNSSEITDNSITI